MSNTCFGTRRWPLAETDFCTWVGQATLGDIVEYHRGFLGIDTDLGSHPAPERKALRRLARRAAWAFEEGLVHLVQRRNGPDDFSYLAIKRPRPRATRRTRPKAARPTRSLDPKLEEAA